MRLSIKNCVNELSEYIISSVAKVNHKPLFIIAGGEIPVKAIDNNKGGRNQHFSIAMANNLSLINRDWAFFSIASDGCDYIKGIAGGFISKQLIDYLKTKNEKIKSYIDNTASFKFHENYGTHLTCEEGTGINVSDIYVFVVI